MSEEIATNARFSHKKVEEFVDRDKANNGINFSNRHREPFEWENENYKPHLVEQEEEPLPYTDIAAEFSGIELG